MSDENKSKKTLIMSYISTTIQTCPNIQAELSDMFVNENFGVMLEPLPFLQFIQSPENKSILGQVVSPGKGKTRTVQVRYDQRISDLDVDDDQSNPNCATGDEVGDMVHEYSIDTTDNVQLVKTVQIQDLSGSCVENNVYMNRLMLRMMDAVERKLQKKHVADLAALNGTWNTYVNGSGGLVVNGSDQLVVKTLKDSSIDPYPYTFQQIQRALNMTGFDNAAIISGGLLVDYYQNMQTGCCATNGVNLMEQFNKYGKAVIYDKFYENVYGDDLAIVLRPKALALLSWTFTSWKDGVDNIFVPSNTGFSTVVYGMRTGIPMDLKIHESSCGTYVNVVLTATTKLVGMPIDMFADGDDFDGVTFVNEIKVTNV